MAELYPRLVEFVDRWGEPFKPRNLPCKEVRPGIFHLSSAELGLYSGASRRLNYRFWAVETLQYMAGHGGDRKHAELLIAVNSEMKKFVNPVTGTFDGAYGPRLAHSLGDIHALLKRDPDSRQAVATIWSPGLPAPSLDVPCTLSMQFLKGSQGLSLVVNMRSNDIKLGLPYDVAAFCAIQCTMASLLNMQVGTYTHIAGSLHSYDNNPVQLAHIGQERWVDVEIPQLRIPPELPNLWTWEQVKVGAGQILDDLLSHIIVSGIAGMNVNHWRNFYSPLEAEHTFWRKWCNLIRWNWKERLR